MFLPQPNDRSFVPPPAGTHAAICYRFIDLGTQIVHYKGEDKTQHKVLISWELPGELMEDRRPFTISRRYTWSMSEKSNLRHDLEAWRGKAFSKEDFIGEKRFNIQNILGVPCLLTIIHTVKDDGTTYGNIKGVAALPKGMTKPLPVNEHVFFTLEPESFDQSVLESFPGKMRDTIMSSPEYAQLTADNDSPRRQEWRDPDDEIPF